MEILLLTLEGILILTTDQQTTELIELILNRLTLSGNVKGPRTL